MLAVGNNAVRRTPSLDKWASCGRLPAGQAGLKQSIVARTRGADFLVLVPVLAGAVGILPAESARRRATVIQAPGRVLAARANVADGQRRDGFPRASRGLSPFTACSAIEAPERELGDCDVAKLLVAAKLKRGCLFRGGRRGGLRSRSPRARARGFYAA